MNRPKMSLNNRYVSKRFNNFKSRQRKNFSCFRATYVSRVNNILIVNNFSRFNSEPIQTYQNEIVSVLRTSINLIPKPEILKLKVMNSRLSILYELK